MAGRAPISPSIKVVVAVYRVEQLNTTIEKEESRLIPKMVSSKCFLLLTPNLQPNPVKETTFFLLQIDQGMLNDRGIMSSSIILFISLDSNVGHEFIPPLLVKDSFYL